MTGLSVTILVAVFLIVIAGLFAVIVERTNERDAARAEVERLDAELANANALVTRINGENSYLSGQVLDAQTRAWDAEHAPLADVVPIEGLRVVEDVPNGDDDIWLNLYDENGQHR